MVKPPKLRYREPRRIMVAGDLGLDLLASPFDPVLMAIGIKAPKLTRKQSLQNRLYGMAATRSGAHMSNAQREKQRDLGRFYRSVAGKAVKQEVDHILARYRRLGEVRR